MKYKPEKQNNPDHALITAVTSAFRSINPSYGNAHTWYTRRNILKTSSARPVRSKYYIPLFGSVFASALALIMIITSQNSPLPTGDVALSKSALNPEMRTVSTFSDNTIEAVPTQTKEKQILAKIDAQSRSTPRTQAEESFTASLNVETSLQDLFQ